MSNARAFTWIFRPITKTEWVPPARCREVPDQWPRFGATASIDPVVTVMTGLLGKQVAIKMTVRVQLVSNRDPRWTRSRPECPPKAMGQLKGAPSRLGSAESQSFQTPPQRGQRANRMNL